MELFDGFANASGVKQGSAVTEARVEVIRCNLARVLPKRQAVTPIANLVDRAQGQNAQEQKSEGELRIADCGLRIPCRSEFAERECHKQEQADAGDIKKAVGHALPTGLHDAGNGEQRAGEPEPADDKVRLTAS